MDRIKILLIAANPLETTRLQLDEEIRLITERIRASDFRDNLELIPALAARSDDLLQKLNEHRPHIVHFSGHGSKNGNLLFVGSDGQPVLIDARALKAVFNVLKDNIRLVVFNACYSRPLAIATSKVIDCVIGMNKAIGDRAAITFAASLYRAIGFGHSISAAYNQGIASLLLEGLAQEKTPQLFSNEGVDPSGIFLTDELMKISSTNISVEPIRRVLALCARRSVFAMSNSEISWKAMLISLTECRIELQKIVAFISPESMQELVIRIIQILDFIERETKNPSLEMIERIDQSKLEIITLLKQLAKEAGAPYRLPDLLRFEMFMNKEEANESPKTLGKRLRRNEFYR